MLTPQRWSLVVGVALGLVALVGIGQILVTGDGGFAWVIVGLAAASAVGALALWTVQRRHGDGSPLSESEPGPDASSGTRPDDRADDLGL